MHSFRHASPVVELALPAVAPQPSFEAAWDVGGLARGPSGPAYGADALSLASQEAPETGDTSWAADVEGDGARDGLAVAARVLQNPQASGNAPAPWDDALDALRNAVGGCDLHAYRAAVALFDPALSLAEAEWVAATWLPLVDGRAAQVARAEAGVRIDEGEDPAAQLATLGALAGRLQSVAGSVDAAFEAGDIGSKIGELVGGHAAFAGTHSLSGFAKAFNAALKMHEAEGSDARGAPLVSAVELANLLAGAGTICLDITEQLARSEGPDIAAWVAGAVAPLKNLGISFAGPMLGFLSIVPAMMTVMDAETPDERLDAWVGMVGGGLEAGAACAEAAALGGAAGASALAGLLSGAAISLAVSWFAFKAAVMQMGHTTWAICAGLVVSHLDLVHGAAGDLLREADEVARARAMADFEPDPTRAAGLRAHADAQGYTLSCAAHAADQSLVDGRARTELIARLRPSLNEVRRLQISRAPVDAILAPVTAFADLLSAAMADPAPIVNAIVGYGPETSSSLEST